jgi:hypothetical protein
MIYDHYLSVSKWSPEFNPATDKIEKMAVWVRFSGLPIEYYDKSILSIIGNRIGRTVKVDRNTLLQERGKYARLCVEVDLTKPLLAMFSIKDRSYKVEYEGLHTLCISCGQFGHYRDGCPKKTQANAPARENNNKDSGNSGVPTVETYGGGEGPWTVVQKPKRTRKAKNAAEDASFAKNSGNIDGVPEITGSRFEALAEPQLEELRNNEVVINQETNTEDIIIGEEGKETDVERVDMEKSTQDLDLEGVTNEEKIRQLIW